MTLTRELRTGIAFTLAMFLVLTAFVLGNQRQAQAAGFGSFLNHCIIFPIVESVVDIDLNEDGECPSGSIPPATLTVVKHVVNTGGGTAQASDFTMHVQGINPSSSSFAGSESGTVIALNPGAYSVTESGPSGYDADYSGGCSGVFAFSNKTCTITNTFHVGNGGGNPQCSDGQDNDTDGLIDFPADPGCTDANDTTESPNPTDTGPACSDGVDNDQDGKIDMQDPGCSSPSDDDETDGQGGGGDSPQCSDGIDNDSDGQIDFPADSNCTDAQDDNEADESSNDNDGDSSGGSSHRRSSGGSSSNAGEVLGAQTECPMYLTGYIRQGANNDLGEVAKLQVFLNTYEANALAVTGIYDAPTLAAVNAFQRKYAADVLTPWGITGATGYVYYTTQKQVNTIYCKFQREFPLSAAQLEEIANVRTIQPAIRAQKAAGTTAGAATVDAGKGGTAPAVGSVVLPQTTVDENATETPAGQSQTAAGANAPTQGWFTRFVNWLFGR